MLAMAKETVVELWQAVDWSIRVTKVEPRTQVP
jgi:hypothetical protein